MTAPADSSAWRGLLRWPLPALLSWAAAWAVHSLVHSAGANMATSWLAAAGLGAGLAWLQQALWRRAIVALGFPLSALALGVGDVPAWLWLLPLGLLVLAYPARTWRDAPWFPTPAAALQGLAGALPLAPQARVLDAGCGLGHGLAALHQQYPGAHIEGVEWSAALRLGAAWRCRFARVRRGDMWAEDWQAFDLVYLFQRPESMLQAVAKARAQMRPGSWLVSLAFEAPGLTPHAVLRNVDGRPVWIYRMGQHTEMRKPAAGAGRGRGGSRAQVT
ncbi:MAG: class I SAM-dependent methyltransferase [Burkholderiales bacterium]